MSAQNTDTGYQEVPWDRHYRSFIGSPQTYDIFAHMQFSLMTLLGLRQEHTLLDIGCGSLRAGKLFLVYLLPGRYFGIEPEQWLVEDGLDKEIGPELAARKQPSFRYSTEFPCTAFGVQFDFLIAQSIFSHASEAQIRKCLAEARASMKDTSIFAASFVEGEEDYAGTEWVYPGIVRYRPQTIERFAREAGLACRRLDWFHIGGQAWFVFFVPGLEPKIDQLAELNQSFPIKEALSHYRARSDRFERIEAMWLYRAAQGIRSLLRK
jgi:hypothetical protein